MLSCCSCNGRNAVCKRCVCAHAGRPYSSCLPMTQNNCVNIPSYGRNLLSSDDGVVSNKDAPTRNHGAPEQLTCVIILDLPGMMFVQVIVLVMNMTTMRHK